MSDFRAGGVHSFHSTMGGNVRSDREPTVPGIRSAEHIASRVLTATRHACICAAVRRLQPQASERDPLRTETPTVGFDSVRVPGKPTSPQPTDSHRESSAVLVWHNRFDRFSVLRLCPNCLLWNACDTLRQPRVMRALRAPRGKSA